MKKLLTILSIILILCACGTDKKQEKTLEEITIVSPKGAPVLAFYDQIENENYTRVAADAISALWSGDSSADIMVVDLTSGLKAIENGADYKLGAIITFGNFYLASTGNDENDSMDEDDRIVLFGNENMLPSRIWHYLYGEQYDLNLVYVADAQQAAAALISGKDLETNDVDYVFLAQPAMFAALKQNEKATLYKDIQQEYKDKSDNDMIQAAVFIKNSLDSKLADEFLNNLETSINTAIDNPELVLEKLSVYKDDEASAQYGFNPNVVVNVFKQKNALGINAMGLGFKRAIDIKKDIDGFVSLFGMSETSEEIYFK